MTDSPSNTKLYLAEFIGTFGLVFMGCGAVAMETHHPGTIGPVGISLAFGVAVTLWVYAIGPVSGAHINPAVTLAFASVKRFPANKILPYVVSQCMGATAAAFALEFLYGPSANLGLTLPATTLEQSIGMEFVITFFLMFVIAACVMHKSFPSQHAGIVIGLAVFVCALIGGGISGASMNPARSLGPALVAGNLNHLWLYIIVPPIAAILGARSYQALN